MKRPGGVARFVAVDLADSDQGRFSSRLRVPATWARREPAVSPLPRTRDPAADGPGAAGTKAHTRDRVLPSCGLGLGDSLRITVGSSCRGVAVGRVEPLDGE